MQVNNIALTTDKCRKPCGFLSFGVNNNSDNEKRKVRYKHYEELSDDVVKARSIIKAHQNAQKSAKMHLYKAIPAIGTGIVATSIAITQPGKLSAKAAKGLGFLAAVSGMGAIIDSLFSKDDNMRKQSGAVLGGLVSVGAAAVMLAEGKAKSQNISKIAKFITKESKQLAKEINATKLSKLSNKYIEPIIKKYPKISSVVPVVTTVVASAAAAITSRGLLKGISNDIKNDAVKNYEHAKAIQQIARDHFNSVDAIEV